MRKQATIAIASLNMLLLAGCSSSAPPVAPTAPPSTSSQAQAGAATKVQPTAAAQSQPALAATTAPAPITKADYPEKGKPISVIVPYAPGGSADTRARLLAPIVEKELRTPVQVINEPGAGSQLGLTKVASSKPDGYTLGSMVTPMMVITYLDPERKATYGRKDLQPIAFETSETLAVAVRTDSPYNSLKDLVDAAKAAPEKVKIAITGILAPHHLALMDWEKKTGARFAPVHFDGSAPGRAALLGGHTDALISFGSEAYVAVQTGEAKVIGVMSNDPLKRFPDAKTFTAQGYPIVWMMREGLLAPGGTAKPVVQILSQTIKKFRSNDQYSKTLTELGVDLEYIDTAESEAEVADIEARLSPLIKEYRSQQK